MTSSLGYHPYPKDDWAIPEYLPLLLYTAIIGIYCENHRQPIITLRGNMPSPLTLQEVVHSVATKLDMATLQCYREDA